MYTGFSDRGGRMKRSKAIKKIKSIIATRGPTQPTIDTAEQVLDMLENELGMLPPTGQYIQLRNGDLVKNSGLGSFQINEWESEDEI